MAKLEFYIGDEQRHIAVTDDGAVPRKGEWINIRGETYKIVRVTWCLDNADAIFSSMLRANVVLEGPSNPRVSI